MCRKVIEAIDTGRHEIDIWGDGTQTRSFCYIDDCIVGIDKIMHSEKLIATPINLGSSELVSINELVSIVEEIAGIKLERHYQLDAPKGVAGRNSDNTFIESVLGWEPRTPLRNGMATTYKWIKGEYEARKAGRARGGGLSRDRVVSTSRFRARPQAGASRGRPGEPSARRSAACHTVSSSPEAGSTSHSSRR